jgi:hypothetical protein
MADVRDAEGNVVFDGFVRLPCTGDGCTVTAYVPVETDPAGALCHACKVKAAKAAKEQFKMAAKKGAKRNGAAAKPANDGGDYIEKGRFEEALPVRIDASEAEARAMQLAKIVHDHDALLERKREVNAQFREKISFFRERMKELSDSVDQCTELRPVACVERLNIRQNAVEKVRLDTGEVYDSRAATAEDRQEDLPGLEGEDDGEEAQP